MISIAESQYYALKHMAHVPLTLPGTQLHGFCHSWLAVSGWRGFQIWDSKFLLHDPTFLWPFWHVQQQVLSQRSWLTTEILASLTESRSAPLALVWLRYFSRIEQAPFAPRVGCTGSQSLCVRCLRGLLSCCMNLVKQQHFRFSFNSTLL